MNENVSKKTKFIIVTIIVGYIAYILFYNQIAILTSSYGWQFKLFIIFALFIAFLWCPTNYLEKILSVGKKIRSGNVEDFVGNAEWLINNYDAEQLDAYQKNNEKRNVNGYMKKFVASNQKWTCKHCQNILDASYEIDHIIPLYKGGTNDATNLVALCRNCHGVKTTKERM